MTNAVVKAVIFALDGTLVQTEALKAISYARAAVELRPDLQEGDVIAGFDDLIGRSRNEVAQTLVSRFNLETAARARMADLGVSQPWEAYVKVRLGIYEHMLHDPELLRRQAFPYAIDLLHKVKRDGYPTGLATMSYAEQANVVIDTLGFRPYLDVIVTRDEVQRPKPDPEIYLLCASRLQAASGDCLVIEDSQPGVEAAVAAGMACVAVASDLTKDGLHAQPPLTGERIVDDPRTLDATVGALLGPRASALLHN